MLADSTIEDFPPFIDYCYLLSSSCITGYQENAKTVIPIKIEFIKTCKLHVNFENKKVVV